MTYNPNRFSWDWVEDPSMLPPVPPVTPTFTPNQPEFEEFNIQDLLNALEPNPLPNPFEQQTPETPIDPNASLVAQATGGGSDDYSGVGYDHFELPSYDNWEDFARNVFTFDNPLFGGLWGMAAGYEARDDLMANWDDPDFDLSDPVYSGPLGLLGVSTRDYADVARSMMNDPTIGDRGKSIAATAMNNAMNSNPAALGMTPAQVSALDASLAQAFATNPAFGGSGGGESGSAGGGYGGYGGAIGGWGGDSGYGGASQTGSVSSAAAANAAGLGGYFGGMDTTSSSQGDSSDSGGKIVCTAMNNAYGFGSFRQAIWLKYSEGMSKEHEVGYHVLFGPLVKFAYNKNTWLALNTRKVLEHIAKHRTADIRAEMKGRKRNRIGQIERAILEPICYMTGKIVSWWRK